ncbi:MAG: hypothetical protein EOO76_09305 [Novosphingobium sp.]|nr:MAG: hypothetical protein EOO76_09305 [Novosphingobium sp.]
MKEGPTRSWQSRGRASRLAKRFAAPAVLAVLAAVATVVSSAAPPAKERIVVPKTLSAGRAAPLLIGVGTHFGIGGEYNYQIGESARLIDELGFDSFRDDLDWPAFQDAKGAFPGRLGQFMAATKARPLLILTAGNRRIEGANPPVTPGGRTAYASFAAQVAATPQGDRALLELGNEWNLRAVMGRAALADAGRIEDPRAAGNYIPLARAAIAAAGAANPRATVLYGAAGTDPQWLWLGAVAAGLKRQRAGLSVHYYNHCKPAADRTASEAIGEMQRLRETLGRTAGTAPDLYITEIGWPTATSCRISREQSADNLAQFLLWSMATPWVRGVWIYQLKDQGLKTDDIEDNFGLYDYNYKPKPSACLVKESIGLSRAMRRSRVAYRSPRITVLDYAGADGRKLIAWTNEPAAVATLRPTGQSVESRPLCGTGAKAATVSITNTPTVIAVAQPAADMAFEAEF